MHQIIDMNDYATYRKFNAVHYSLLSKLSQHPSKVAAMRQPDYKSEETERRAYNISSAQSLRAADQ